MEIKGFEIYLNFDDQWVGRYRGDTHNYVCPVPCLVIQWKRKVKNS